MLRLVAAALVLAPSISSAQGLLWKLPPDGESATYAGTVTQVLRRTGSTEQDVELTFNRQLEVRSVGQQQGEWNGETVPARWIEMEQTTTTSDGSQSTGPGGQVLVKLLVPESFIDGQVADPRGIPKSAIPMIRGYVLKDGGEIEELSGNTYQPFPAITLLGMPKNLADQGGSLKSTETIESPTSRIELDTTIVPDPNTPFGIASWTVTSKESDKQAAEPRSSFILRSETSESMELKRTGSGAISAIDRN